VESFFSGGTESEESVGTAPRSKGWSQCLDCVYLSEQRDTKGRLDCPPRAVLDGLCEVGSLNALAADQVGDGARQLQDAEDSEGDP
jgi:hypothetical protein